LSRPPPITSTVELAPVGAEVVIAVGLTRTLACCAACAGACFGGSSSTPPAIIAATLAPIRMRRLRTCFTRAITALAAARS
jgi:hypothetical protein